MSKNNNKNYIVDDNRIVKVILVKSDIKVAEIIDEQDKIIQEKSDKIIEIVEPIEPVVQNDFLGEMSIIQAQKLADEYDLDLVEVSKDADGLSVCKIMNYGRYKYDLQKKQKDAKKNQQVVKIKEVQLSSSIEGNDYDRQVQKIKDFLKKGYNIKVLMKIKRMRDKTLAMQNAKDKINDIKEQVKDLCIIKDEPNARETAINMMLIHKK